MRLHTASLDVSVGTSLTLMTLLDIRMGDPVLAQYLPVF